MRQATSYELLCYNHALCKPVADPDLELTGGVGGGVDLLAMLAFIPSVISAFYPK